MADRLRFLMCAPDHYDVDYVINPWMAGNLHRASPELAQAQWRGLHDLLESLADVELIAPRPGVPDLVFTANAGVVVDDIVVLSRFMHAERRAEEPFFLEWFERQGYRVHRLPDDLPFEGAGDALLDRSGGWLWAGYGFRSELDAHARLARWLEIEVLSLRLIDERFYHLDTCFCPLEGGHLLFYPPAFDTYSNRLIERRVPEAKRIAVPEDDALQFACNAVNVGASVILNRASEPLKQRLQSAGFQVLETPLTEFLKAGGAAKCLTLRLNEPLAPHHAAHASVESRTIHLEGHLLDTGLINRCLDRIVEGGGSFQVLEFHLGEQRQSVSSAAIRVTAPDHAVMDTLLAQLIDLGAHAGPQELQDNPLATVRQDGVAPDDFTVSTIYPTEVRVEGRWLRVGAQRMDGAIVVAATAGGMGAECRLLRDLKRGDRVAVGTEGLRTVRRPELREPRGQEFGFMGAGVSSERRVELVVEQIAWELRRIRDRGGKVVVVAG
ncbi:MAG TPA: arginine deiminase-related protein, partial [Cyanobium sp.]|nr:arginine deiminase-related protein [Cyanobium sp.]